MGTTPVLVNLGGSLKLSSQQDGVMFDLDGTGTPRQWSWPVSNDGWLVLDRNSNGIIDNGTELFGNATLKPNGSRATNGFLALAQLDSNSDGLLDAKDAAFAALRVWVDTTRDGRSDPAELLSLDSLGINALSVETNVSRRRDQWGNLFRWRAPVYFASGDTRYAYDVILTRSSVPKNPNACKPVDSEVK